MAWDPTEAELTAAAASASAAAAGSTADAANLPAAAAASEAERARLVGAIRRAVRAATHTGEAAAVSIAADMQRTLGNLEW